MINRIAQLIEYLGVSVRQFEVSISASNGLIRKAIANNTDIQSKWIAAVAENYPHINSDWLLTGEGEMLKEKSASTPVNSPTIVRYWPEVEATGSGIISFDDQQHSGYQEMVLPNFKDCTDALPLFGDSMSPKYKAGQIIIVKEWKESYIEYGQAYLIVTLSGHRMVKYLRPDADPARLSCVSENSEVFPPFHIEKRDILKLYLVKGVIEQTSY